MGAMLFFGLVVTVFFAITGCFLGAIALRLMVHYPNRSELRSAAFNLFEPSVTIAVVLFVGFATGSSPFNQVIVVVCAGISMAVMLLAPLGARGVQPLQSVVAVYSVLRYANTAALYAVSLPTPQNPSGWYNPASTLPLAFFCSGLLLLGSSLLHIGLSLEALQPRSAQ